MHGCPSTRASGGKNDGYLCDPGTGLSSIQAAEIAPLNDPEHHPPMEWTTPTYAEVKMDAEIGSYQEDGERVPIVERQADEAPAAAE